MPLLVGNFTSPGTFAMVHAMGTRGHKDRNTDRRMSIARLLHDNPDFNAAPNAKSAAGLEAVRGRCREWAQRFDDASRTSRAFQFTCAALNALANEWLIGGKVKSRLAEQASLLDAEAAELAGRIARDLGSLPRAHGLYLATSLYPALLPQRRRRKLGAFYTPPALTNRAVELLSEHGVDWATAKVLDPAAGAGAFLVDAAWRMADAMEGAEPAFVLRQLGSRLCGMEVDENAAFLAQSALEIILADTIAAAGLPAPQFIQVCDGLELPPVERFDVVIGNPPYGRVSLTPEQRARFGRSLYGHANLYGVFTDLALRWCKPGGLIAYLTPTSFLAGRYYGALRDLLLADAPPLAIDLVHARQGVFEDVLQETLLAVYRKGAPRTRVQIHYLTVRGAAETTVKRNGTVALPSEPKAPWLAPRSPEHGPLIASSERMRCRLKDWGYHVSTGPLVWNRFKDQLCEEPGKDVLPLVWAECVLSDGRFEFRARKRHHTPYFRLGSRDAWLVVTQPCVLVQRTTAKEQARRLIAAEMPANFVEQSGVVVENHLNMVQPGKSPKVELAVVAALLNSEVVDELFRCMNGSVAVSAFELESMPLPSPQVLARLGDLVREDASRERIEAECKRLYGLS